PAGRRRLGPSTWLVPAGAAPVDRRPLVLRPQPDAGLERGRRSVPAALPGQGGVPPRPRAAAAHGPRPPRVGLPRGLGLAGLRDPPPAALRAPDYPGAAGTETADPGHQLARRRQLPGGGSVRRLPAALR